MMFVPFIKLLSLTLMTFVAYDVCRIIGFVSYHVCRLIGFVANDVCRIMRFVNHYDVCCL